MLIAYPLQASGRDVERFFPSSLAEMGQRVSGIDLGICLLGNPFLSDQGFGQAVRMMDKIARQAESSPFMTYNRQYSPDPADRVTHAVAQSAVNILGEIDARCIIVFSQSGGTSMQISKQRPVRPVYAFTSRMDTYHRLSLMWGITPMFIADIQDATRLIRGSENLLIEKNHVKKGDLIVLERNPLQSIEVVQDVLMVVSDGKVIVQRGDWPGRPVS